MSDLGRMLEDGAEDAFLRDALASASEDVPDAARRAATLSALSPDLIAEPSKANAPVTVPPTGPGSSPKAEPAAPTAAPAASATGATLKWVVIVGLAAGAIGVGVYATSGPDAAPAERSTPGSTASVVASPAAAPSIDERAPGNTPMVMPSTPASTSEPAVASAQAAKLDPAAKASATAKERAPLGLAEETAILDRARGALERKDPRGALLELDRYDAAPGPKILGQEATMVRIEALSTKGDTAAARALGQSFLQRNPGSTYDDRVRALIAEPKKP